MAAFEGFSQCLFQVSKYFCKARNAPIAMVYRSMAGHSKWANIKFKKMHRDIARAKILGRLHKEIVTVVRGSKPTLHFVDLRENGPDPTLNPKLEHLINRAKAANMTKEKIESAIKSGIRNTGEITHALLIEGHGPGGCGILLDTLTSNKSRTRTEIRTIFTKNGGHVGDEGSVSFLYEHKGVINVENLFMSAHRNDENPSEEVINQAEELAIEVGAESVEFGRNSEGLNFIQFICAPKDLIHISNGLTRDHGCTLLSGNLEYLPRNLITLNDKQLEKVDRLLERLLEHEDVVKTYDNIMNYDSDTYKYS